MNTFAKWMKVNLFPTPIQTIISVIIFSLIIKLLTLFFDWFIFNAVWIGDAATCRQATGACVAFIKEKFTFIIFGFYPREFLWRPILALTLFISSLLWFKEPKRLGKKTLLVIPATFLICGLLMKGGLFGLKNIDVDQWGGLPLTLLLASIGILFSYPIGILLALGRGSQLPAIKGICVGYIELIRGVPMISLLFMASVMFPLFLPDGIVFPKILRAQIAIIMFMSAYMAEVVRGGLAAIPQGQYEAADALGLNYWQKMIMIILPQALKIVIPPTVNTAIGMFKDTSLVVIIALFDLLMTSKTALKDAIWLGFSLEAYIFVAMIYFIFCYGMGRYSRRLEGELSRGY